jgi:zinc transporter 2
MKLEKETRLKLAIGLSSVFVVVEVIGGYIANSIAIYSDAAHLLTDIAGFGIALIAVVASKAPGTKHLTFGLARAEVFGALGSIASLWVITAFLLYAAYCRAYGWFTGNADDVNGFFMFLVACFGVLVNICLGLVFQEDHGGDFHPSHSSCGHDHSHDGSHAHAHENAQTSAYVKVPVTDLEHGHDSADHSSCGGGHDHGHDHNHKKDSKKNNNSIKNTTKSPLIDDHSHGAHSYQSMEDGGHDHGHGHASSASHAEHAEHDHSTCGGHDHAEVAHDAHDHSTCGGHGHDEHDHAPHNLIEATLKSPTDVNIEAAYLHVLTDLIQSIGVAIAGLCIWFKPHWQIIDPLCTFIFSFVALRSTIPLLKRVFTILLEGTPSHVSFLP